MTMHDHKRDPLNLAGLPQPEPPPGDPWPVIAAALQRRRRRRLGGWAAAAAVALSFALAWQVLQQTPLPQPDSQFAAERAIEPQVHADIPSVEAGQRDGAASPDPAAETIATLAGLSQQLESRLRRLRAEAGMLPADTLMYQVELEDLVAQVDDALSRRPDSRALWSQRVNLLLDLNQLYHQELRREQLPIASL